jgi:uncharacterized protein (TIGR03083 family)
MDHDEAMKLAADEYQRLLDVLESLAAEEWSRATDCPGWDVKAIVGHTLGMMERNASQEETARQSKAAGEAAQQTGSMWLDALTALQVEEHAHLSPEEMVTTVRATAAGAVAGRFGTTAEQRAVAMNPGPPFDEEWTVGYLLEVIHTRDTWMHRVDICRATGRPLVLTADHDGRIVADAVEDWARRHGQPFELVLGGPAGGTFTRGSAGEQLRLDAVELCRVLSGRAEASGLLRQEVPF